MKQTKNIIIAFLFVFAFAFAGAGSALATKNVLSVGAGAQSGTLTYGAGGSSTYAITTSRDAGFGGNITFSVILGLPSGATASFSPNPAIGSPYSSTLTVSTLVSAPAGTYTITIQAQDNSSSQGTVTTTATLTVSPKALTATGTLSVPSSKVYDGTTSATVSGAAALQSAETIGTGTASDGKPYTGDTVSLTGTASYAYNSKDVASAAAVNESGLSLTGASSGNYTLSAPSLSATITAKALTAQGTLTAPTKVYNGTTTATPGGAAGLQTAESTGSGTSSDGKPYSGDTVSLTGTASYNYTSKDVGATVVNESGLSLTGAQAGDYSLTAPSLSGASITAKPLTVTATGPSKTYGTALSAGTSTVNFSAGATGVGSEAVTSVTLTPDGAGLSATTAAGLAYVVTPSLATGTGGFLESNYQMTYTAFNGTVAQKALTITADNDAKMYGTTKSYGAGSTAFTSTGLQNGETIGTVTITASGGTAGTDPVGPYTLTPSAAMPGTFTAANYSITYNPGTLQVLTALSGTSDSAGLPSFTAGTIPVTFVAKDSGGNILGTAEVQVNTANGGESFTFTIGVPSGTATISLKPRFYLRKLFTLPTPVTTEDTVTLDMTGVVFVGGDADGNNQVDGTDYAWIRTFWGQTTGSHDQYDINGDTKINADDFPDLNGDGVIDVHDYDILKNGWY
jgi:hypothetical protein